MTTLIACLGNEQHTWLPVFKLAALPNWEKIIFIGTAMAQHAVNIKENTRFILVDDTQPINTLAKTIQEQLGTIFGEVGVNLYSGSGSMHMATLSAILKLGGGIKLVHHDTSLLEL